MRISGLTGLLVGTSLALCIPALADTYYFRARTPSPAAAVPDAVPPVGTVPKDTQPASFAFAPSTGVEPGVASFSPPVTLADFDGAPMSVSGGGYQICASADCSDRVGQPVLIAPVAEVTAGTRVRLAATPSVFGVTATATLTVGTVSASYAATARARDDAPDGFSFPAVVGTAGQPWIVSATALVANHDGVTASVSGSGSPEFQACLDAACTSVARDWSSADAVLPSLRHVRLRIASASVVASTDVRFAAGNTAATWSVGPAPVVVADSGQRDGFAWRCAGGMVGKVCKDAQLKVADPDKWDAYEYAEGTVARDQWFSLWSGDKGGAARFFCRTATGAQTVTSAVAGTGVAGRPLAITEWRCEYNASAGSTCRDLPEAGSPNGVLSFWEKNWGGYGGSVIPSGKSGTDVQCASF